MKLIAISIQRPSNVRAVLIPLCVDDDARVGVCLIQSTRLDSTTTTKGKCVPYVVHRRRKLRTHILSASAPAMRQEKREI